MAEIRDSGIAYNKIPIRIMVASDNPASAQTMSVMLRKANPDWDVIDICLSSRETIDKANVLHPDIILIDQNIRGISGLDAIEAIQNTAPDVRFIILATDRDFDCVFKALKLGVSDYFVAPIDQEALLAAIQKTAADISALKEAKNRETHTQERIEAALRIIKKDYLKILLPGSAQDRKLLTYAHFLGVAEQPGFMIAILQHKKKPTFRLLETVIYRLSTQFELLGTSVQPGLAIAFIPIVQDGDTDRQKVLTHLDNLLIQFQRENENITCGAGGIYSDPLQMKTSLRQALAALNYMETADTPFEQCIIYDEAVMPLPEEQSAAENSGERMLPSTKVSLDQAIAYIEKNYQRDLTLNEVAACANLSPYYFCKIFKKYAGKSFSKFLLNVRINKAKELLDDKNNTIKKVAYQVGFNDPNYFSKVFHSVTGIRASEYKK